MVLVFACIIGFVWFLPMLLNPQDFRFKHRSAKYYADFTAACDSVLVEHPLGTNELLFIPLADASLPKIITDLHPCVIQVSRRGVFLGLGGDDHALKSGIEWEPQQGDTNIWVLNTVYGSSDSLDCLIYVTKR